MKVCTGCGVNKVLGEYYKRPAPRTDTQQPCKDCYRDAARRRRELNPEYGRAWAKQRRASRSEEEKAALRKYMLQWQRANREKVAQYHHQRRAREQGSEYERFNPADIAVDTCDECGSCIDTSLRWPDPMSKSLDHIFPLSRGGSHSKDNVRWVHLVCNLRKGARPYTSKGIK